jgi:hypothetical protein
MLLERLFGSDLSWAHCKHWIGVFLGFCCEGLVFMRCVVILQLEEGRSCLGVKTKTMNMGIAWPK